MAAGIAELAPAVGLTPGQQTRPPQPTNRRSANHVRGRSVRLSTLMKLFYYLAAISLISTAFTLGWFLGQRESANPDRLASKKSSEHLIDSQSVADALNEAAQTNLLLGERFSDQEKRSMLLAEILVLSRAEPHQEARHIGIVDGDSVFLMHARNALEILGVESEESLDTLLAQEAEFAGAYRSTIVTPDGSRFGTPIDFAHRALKSRRIQPSYPAKQWLTAVTTGDVELLKNCFPNSMSLPAGESWDSLLKNYRDVLSRAGRTMDRNAFNFPWSANGTRGEVFLELEEKAVMTFPVVKVGKEWKLKSLEMN